MAQIFLVAGAPAVGKSTTARALAAQFPKSIYIPVDDVRNMVVSGILLPSENWGPELIEQLALARRSVSQMAAIYSKAGFVVVIDDFWDPISQLAEYQELWNMPNTYRILLYPDQHAALERNLRRSGPGKESDYIAGGIRLVYEDLRSAIGGLERVGWLIFDTTEMTITDTVDRILERTGKS